MQTRWSEGELLPETARQVPPAEAAAAVATPVEVILQPHPKVSGSPPRAPAL